MQLTSGFAQFTPFLLIALTVVSSVAGFSNRTFFDRYKFNTGAILYDKQWDRLISSAFLHGDYMHLIFNMMTLYFFSELVIYYTSVWQYLIIYFAAIASGGLLSLWIHRRESYYSAIGASGGVVGILFAAIALEPTMSLYMFFIPVPIPAWIFGVAYLLYSVYSMQKGGSIIGHDAHLGGAAAGLILIILFVPEVLTLNLYYILLMILPLIILGYVAWKKKE